MRNWLLVGLVVFAACKKANEARPVEKDKDKKEEVAPPPKKIDGPSVTPIKTESVAFVVPKAETAWWGEMNFSCYRALMSLSGTKTAGEAFERLSPAVPGAMAAGGIDIGRDLAAIGAFDCGGTPCIYAVAHLEQPEKMGEVVSRLMPTPAKDMGKGHWVAETQGVNGPRSIHIRMVPIQWSAVPGGDDWNKEAAKATHVVFMVGVDGKNMDIDPLTKLADAQTALANVKDAEGTLADAHGRCILGRVGQQDFQPGFKLDRARFALAVPPGKNDPLMAMMGSQRTLELNVELVLSPAAKDADVKKWIQQARAWMSDIGAPLRAQFAGNPMLDVFADMASLLGERGFKYDLKDKSLRLSWRTDRVPRADLDALEKRFQEAGGASLLGTP